MSAAIADPAPSRRATRRPGVSRPFALAAALSLATACAPAGGARAGAAPRVFFDAAACREARALSDADCETAYANARAEFDEKAPRFASRAECERFFRRCMIGDIEGGGRRVAFTPQMRGFAIADGRGRQVVPVAEGGGAEGLFRPRAVNRPDASASAAARAEAQEAWKRMVAAPTPSFGPGEADADAPALVGPARAYPLPPGLLLDLKNRERAFGAPASP
jgi:hypothetical protein